MLNTIDTQLKMRGLSRKEFARQCGVGQSLICEVLRGRSRSQRVIQALAEALNWTPEQVVAFIPRNHR